jgi:hypothetical protein
MWYEETTWEISVIEMKDGRMKKKEKCATTDSTFGFNIIILFYSYLHTLY